MSRVVLSLAASAVFQQTIHRSPGVDSSVTSFPFRCSSTMVERPGPARYDTDAARRESARHRIRPVCHIIV